MKLKLILIFLSFCLITTNDLLSQQTIIQDSTYIIKTYNGGEFQGRIISNDTKEITIRTNDRGDITIPKFEVKEMYLLDSDAPTHNLSSNDDPYSVLGTNYLLSKNAFSIPRGESYIGFNYTGADFQFGITDNVDIGIITTWIAMPIIGNIKLSTELSEKNTYVIWYVCRGIIMG